MPKNKYISGGSLALFLLFVLGACKKSPTTATINLGGNSILVACDPASAGPGTTVAVAVLIVENSQEIRVFGLEMSFDSQVFEYQEVSSGNLTSGWTAVDANEVNPGTLRIGGFAGGGSIIPGGSRGAVAVVRLKVAAATSASSEQSQICVHHLTDDLSGFQPEPACATFTLKK